MGLRADGEIAEQAVQPQVTVPREEAIVQVDENYDFVGRMAVDPQLGEGARCPRNGSKLGCLMRASAP